MSAHPYRIAIVGGSHAGLLTALALRRAGADVEVYERAPGPLEARGAGLRIQPLMAEILRDAGIDLAPASTFTHFDRHIGPGNRIVFEQPENGHFVSWGSLYRFLLEQVGRASVHFGEAYVGSTERDAVVDLRFASGRNAEADLVVFADGIASTGRRRLKPGVVPHYSGYVAWRGLVRDRDLSDGTRAVLADACTFTVAGLSHMPIYPVPGDGADGVQASLWNVIWYRNVAEGAALDELMTDCTGLHRPNLVPAGLVQQRLVDQLRQDAQVLLAPAAAEVMIKAEAPFIQPICDLVSDRIVFGRQILVGDAAAVTTPHVGAGTAKAVLGAWSLADIVARVPKSDDLRLAAALSRWEVEQIARDRDLVARGRMIGRRAQVDGTFTPGAPELSRITMPQD